MPLEQRNVLRWQGEVFTEPFDFALGKVSAVQFPMSGTRVYQSLAPAADFGFELAEGDLLYGNLVGMTPSEVELETPGLGRLKVLREYLSRMVRRQAEGHLIYQGPNQRTDWQVAPTSSSWREDAGHLVTDQSGATLLGNFDLPAQARIEIELSWDDQANFMLALGATEGILETRHQALEWAFRLEVWEEQLVALRASDSEADVAALAKLKHGAGRIHLLLLLDQTRGYLRVLSTAGETLGEVRAGAGQTGPGKRLWLLNRGGSLRLEGIRVSRWDGSFSVEGPADQTRIERLEGTTVVGLIERFDQETGELVLAGEGGPRRVRLDEVARVQFNSIHELPAQSMRVILQNGCRLRGELLEVGTDLRETEREKENRAKKNSLEAAHLWMSSAALVEPVGWPVQRLRSLMVLQDGMAPAVARLHGGSACRLESAGTQLHGMLVTRIPARGKAVATLVEEAAAQPPPGSILSAASCILWQPLGSITASPLKQSVAARIVYRDPPPKPKTPKPKTRQKNRQPRPQQLPAGVWGALMKALADQGEAPAHKGQDRGMLYLRSGDTVPCKVTRIDSKGVHFQTPLSGIRLVSHDQVKGVVLTRSQRTIVLSKAKRQRLLTLPRMHRENPPTHLVCSMTGDYLRGRLLGMDAQTLRMEVRLETVGVPREHVSHVIWLHENELEGEKEKLELELEAVANPIGPLRAQAVRGSGVRMTFAPQRLVADGSVRMPPPATGRETDSGIPAIWRPATALLGTSRVLGECRVELKDIDRLLLGGAIEQEAAQLVQQGWKLHHAREPKIVSTQSGSRIPGTAAALVGKPAPDFQLDLLGGKSFHLRDCLGQIVVLDFWAGWCGPCMQAMPQMDRLIRDLPGDQVRLVAVNLQERPEQIISTLERHGLEQLGSKRKEGEAVIALDLDGVVAEKYTATAIPQTVVIDPQGDIARLFVGGGPQYLEQLREALEGLLEEGKASSP
jgi:thiol-disulfide isomerase/thioredoxin